MLVAVLHFDRIPRERGGTRKRQVAFVVPLGAGHVIARSLARRRSPEVGARSRTPEALTRSRPSWVAVLHGVGVLGALPSRSSRGDTRWMVVLEREDRTARQARKAYDWSSARGNAHSRRHPRPNSGCQPRSDRDVSSLGQAAARLTLEPIGARPPRRERWTDSQVPSRSRRLTVRRRRIAVTISFRANSKRVRHLRSSRRARVSSFARAKRLIGPLHLYLSSTRRIWLVWCASWWVAASRLVQTLASSGRRPSLATRPNSKKQITGGTGPHAGEPTALSGTVAAHVFDR
jgi:hypothetical protein